MEALAKFHITEDCTGCSACESIAPEHFEPTSRGVHHCFAQPRSTREVERCRDAAQCCPVEAIVETDTAEADTAEADTAISDAPGPLTRG